jgi:hypothetical protein
MDARQNLLSRVRINRAQRVVQDVDVCILVHSTRKADPLLLATYENGIFAPFIYINDDFTKTGSGQT